MLIETMLPHYSQRAIVKSLEFHWRHISAVFIQAPVVEPVQVGRRFRLNVIRIPPWPPRLDQLRLIQTIDRFGQRIVMRVADSADRRINPGFEETLGETNRRILAPASL